MSISQQMVCIQKKLYESIPEQYRPPLETNGALKKVAFALFNRSQMPLGSTIMPIILTDAITGQKFCIKLYAFVFESESMPTDMLHRGFWHRIPQKSGLGNRNRDLRDEFRGWS